MKKKLGALRRRKKPESATLPSVEIPDVRSDLDVLLKGTGVKLLVDKAPRVVVPTIFPGFNRATRVGGLPSGIYCVTGPSGEGKTALGLGLIQSFQRQGHLCHFEDAEGTLDKDFAQICDVDLDQLPYEIPETYEESHDRIAKLIKNFRNGRKSGDIHSDRCLFIVLDSITKLTPESELTKKEIKKAYPLRALMNTLWLDKLTPVIAKEPIFFLMFAHEKEVIDEKSNVKIKKHKGGDALRYDSTLFIRVDIVKSLRAEIDGEKHTIGDLHRVIVQKNKVGIKKEQFFFVMSNGKGGTPVGFDVVRGIMEEAKLRGKNSPIVRASGGLWKHKGLPDGSIKFDSKFLAYVSKRPGLIDQMIEDLNETAMEAIVAQPMLSEEE